LLNSGPCPSTPSSPSRALIAAADEVDRLAKLYALADVNESGEIVMSVPLAKSSQWDGNVAWWSRGHFNEAIDDIKETV
jgi:hypothetical protein